MRDPGRALARDDPEGFAIPFLPRRSHVRHAILIDGGDPRDHRAPKEFFDFRRCELSVFTHPFRGLLVGHLNSLSLCYIETVGIETIVGDPFDGMLENGRVYRCGSVDTKASLGLCWRCSRHAAPGRSPQAKIWSSAPSKKSALAGPLLQRRGLNLGQLVVVVDPRMCAPIYTIRARRFSSPPVNLGSGPIKALAGRRIG